MIAKVKTTVISLNRGALQTTLQSSGYLWIPTFENSELPPEAARPETSGNRQSSQKTLKVGRITDETFRPALPKYP